MILAMAADIVLRRNMRIAYTPGPHRLAPTGFDSTTHGSHHVSLCDEVNKMWNTLVQTEQARGIQQPYELRAVMPVVPIDETFGLGREQKKALKKEDPDDDTLYYFENNDGIDDETTVALVDAVDGTEFKPGTDQTAQGKSHAGQAVP